MLRNGVERPAGKATMRRDLGGLIMKMRIGETLEGAFGFLFRSIVSVLGTIWLPYVAGAVVIFAVAYAAHPDWSAMFNMNDGNAAAAAMLRAVPVFGLGWLIFVVVDAMVRVGLMRKALGLHEGPVFVFFSLGVPVWRMIGANFLVFLISTLVVAAAVAVGVGGVMLAQNAMPQPWRGLFDVLLVIALILGALYVPLRLFFFLPAVVVGEERIGLGRAWELGKSNVLRILVVSAAIAIAVSFVAGALTAPFMQSMPFPTPGSQPSAQDMMRLQMAMWHTMAPVFVIQYVVQTIALTALNTGAVATAYRAMNGTQNSLSSVEGTFS